jgi:hypothetical protein
MQPPLAPSRAVLSALLVAALACSSPSDRPTKGTGSAVWAAPADVAALSTDEREALRSAGVAEAFLEAGRLAEGSTTIEPALSGLDAVAAARFPVTLVVAGSWPAASGEEAADELAGELRRLRVRAEVAGVTVIGYHLDLVPPAGDAALERYAAALADVAAAIDSGIFLSVSLDAATLEKKGMVAVADAVDFAVAFLYGPRADDGPGTVGDEAWSLSGLGPRLARLDELGLPFLVGVGTIGQMAHLDGDGNLVEVTTGADLPSLFGRRGLGLPRADVLDVLDRQSYRLQAERALAVGDWRLAAGDWLRVTRLSSHHVSRLAAAAAEADGYLGLLFHRLRREGEELSLSAFALAGAASGETTTELAVEVEPAGSGNQPFRVRIANRGAQPTEVAFIDGNYVEVRALGGAAFADVSAGGFRRYDLEHEGRRVDNMRALRQADVIKLYVPLLEPGDEVTSGALSLRGAPRQGELIELGGLFYLPGGDVLELTPRRWPAPPAPEGGDGGGDLGLDP